MALIAVAVSNGPYILSFTYYEDIVSFRTHNFALLIRSSDAAGIVNPRGKRPPKVTYKIDVSVLSNL